MRIYQRRYPDNVVALVLVDPSHEDGLFTMFNGRPVTIASLTAEQLHDSIPADPQPTPWRPAQAGPPFDRLPADLYHARVALESALIEAMTAVTLTRELVMDVMEGQWAAFSELHDASAAEEHSLGDLPVVVLSRGDVRRGQFDRHAALAGESSRGHHQQVQGAGHEIHLFRPDALIDAIREVLAAVGPKPEA